MYRQQAERVAEKLRLQRRTLSVEIYQDGLKSRTWLVRAYDPVHGRTRVFDCESQAMNALKGEYT